MYPPILPGVTGNPICDEFCRARFYARLVTRKILMVDEDFCGISYVPLAKCSIRSYLKF